MTSIWICIPRKWIPTYELNWKLFFVEKLSCCRRRRRTSCSSNKKSRIRSDIRNNLKSWILSLSSWPFIFINITNHKILLDRTKIQRFLSKRVPESLLHNFSLSWKWSSNNFPTESLFYIPCIYRRIHRTITPTVEIISWINRRVVYQFTIRLLLCYLRKWRTSSLIHGGVDIWDHFCHSSSSHSSFNTQRRTLPDSLFCFITLSKLLSCRIGISTRST